MPYVEPKRVFEHIALIRLQVESSYIGFNPMLDSETVRNAVLKKLDWFKAEWPPAGSSEHLVAIAGISKLKAYLEFGAKFRPATARELDQFMEAKYAAVYAAVADRRTPVDKYAVFRFVTVIEEGGDVFSEYRVLEGELPVEVDELDQFLQANARLDLHKKLELLGSAVDVCGWERRPGRRY